MRVDRNVGRGELGRTLLPTSCSSVKQPFRILLFDLIWPLLSPSTAPGQQNITSSAVCDQRPAVLNI